MTERMEKYRSSRIARWLELFNPGDLFGTGDGKGGNGRGNRGKGKGGSDNGGNGSGDGGDGNGNGNGQPPRQSLFLLLLLTVVLFACISYFMRDNGESRKISYNEFIKYIQQEKVTEVDMKSDRLEIHLKDSDAVLYTGIAESEDALTQRLMDAKITYNPYVPDSSGMVVSFLLSYVLPILLMWGLLSMAALWASARARPRNMSSRRPGSPSRMSQERMRPRSPWSRSSISCTIRAGMSRSAQNFPREPFSWGLPEQARPCSPRLSPERRMCPSFP